MTQKSNGGRRPGSGRKPGFIVTDRWREKIKTGVLLSRLQRIAQGEINSEPNALGVQVRASQILLAKVMPDLQAVTHDGNAWSGEIKHIIEVRQMPEQHAQLQHEPIAVEHRVVKDEK